MKLPTMLMSPRHAEQMQVQHQSSASMIKSTNTSPSIHINRHSIQLALPHFRRQKSSAINITHVDIYYGTLRGTAERLARKLAKDVAARGLKVQIQDLECFDETIFVTKERFVSSRLVVFVVSTHFVGSPSPSGERFHRWMLSLSMLGSSPMKPSPRRGFRGFFCSEGSPVLAGLQYAVFGVGDSSYVNYNAWGKFIDNGLRKLGANRFYPMGLGDCRVDVEAGYNTWSCSFLDHLPIVVIPSRSISNLKVPQRPPSRLTSQESSDTPRSIQRVLKMQGLYRNLRIQYCNITSRTSLDSNHAPFAQVVSIHTLRPNVARSNVAMMRLKILDERITFNTADNCALYPHNPSELVEKLAHIFGYDLNAWIEIIPNEESNSRNPFPSPCTVRTILTDYLELASVSQEFLRSVTQFATNIKEQEQLEYFGSIEGYGAYRQHIYEEYKSIVDLVTMMPSLQLSLDVLINIMPLVKVRMYSIASCPHESLSEFDLTLSLGPTDQARGLSVSYFEKLLNESPPIGVTFRGFITPSAFCIPDDNTAPMIMIANGVGAGTIRALLKDRLFEAESGEGIAFEQQKRVQNLVFLGCTDRDSLVFQEDFFAWEALGLVKIYMALSQDPNEPSRYVQEIVRQHVENIFDAMNNGSNGKIYVCGTSSMVKSIYNMLSTGHDGKSTDWVARLVESDRYIAAGYARRLSAT